jgi:hypothetical protein
MRECAHSLRCHAICDRRLRGAPAAPACASHSPSLVCLCICVYAATEAATIFHNIDDLSKLADSLCADFEEIAMEKVLTTQLGTTLLHYAPRFRIYQTYLENYDDAVKVLDRVRREKPEFDFFCKLSGTRTGGMRGATA